MILWAVGASHSIRSVTSKLTIFWTALWKIGGGQPQGNNPGEGGGSMIELGGKGKAYSKRGLDYTKRCVGGHTQ